MIDSIAHEKLILPRPVTEDISSPLGPRMIANSKEFHRGIDFATPIGTPVRAVADGYCFRAGWESESDRKKGFGLRVWHEFTYNGRKFYAWYAHLSVLTVKSGDLIGKGQVVGLSGNTGRSTGPHLHMQFRELNTNLIYDVEWTS